MEEYLDAGPMIRALSEDPGEFEMSHGYVLHRSSDHWLGFDTDGNARLFARCSCAELAITREQGEQLQAAVAAWEQTYWRPLMAREAAARRVAEINRAFARHFRRRGKWRRAFNAFLSCLGFPAERRSDRVPPLLPEQAALTDRVASVARQMEEDEWALF